MRPGIDDTRDSGEGEKPVVPTVTTKPESSPPEVIKTVTNEITEIVDSSTNEPGQETSVTAPDATDPGTSREPDNVPAPEPKTDTQDGDNGYIDTGGF